MVLASLAVLILDMSLVMPPLSLKLLRVELVLLEVLRPASQGFLGPR
jgi:hypothetical protein